MNWIYVCEKDAIDDEDLICWHHEAHVYAVYNTDGGFLATDGMCTHEAQSLEEGLVVSHVIECPLHGGRFDIPTGKALSAPVIDDLRTYPVKVEDDKVYIAL